MRPRRCGLVTAAPRDSPDQFGPLGLTGTEGIGQRADRVRVGAGALSPLKRTDAMRGEAGALGQLLLGKARVVAQATQDAAEGRPV